MSDPRPHIRDMGYSKCLEVIDFDIKFIFFKLGNAVFLPETPKSKVIAHKNIFSIKKVRPFLES